PVLHRATLKFLEVPAENILIERTDSVWIARVNFEVNYAWHMLALCDERLLRRYNDERDLIRARARRGRHDSHSSDRRELRFALEFTRQRTFTRYRPDLDACAVWQSGAFLSDRHRFIEAGNVEQKVAGDRFL